MTHSNIGLAIMPTSHKYHRGTRLLVICAVLLSLLAECHAATDAFGTNWKPLAIGAGGFITGIDIASNGTKVIRTDTYGAYLWNGTKWTQLVNSTSMPASYVNLGENDGVYEIRIAPSNTQRLYMMYLGAVFRSDNDGVTWTQTAFAPVSGSGANDNYRVNAYKMAVDPINPDVVYVGTTNNGAWVTANGGTSFTQVTSIPAGTSGQGGMTGIAFDPSSGQAGGKTNTIYIGSWGNGVYRSTNAGSTWVKTSGGPTAVTNAVVASDGIYYAADNKAAWKYASGVWTNLASYDWHSVAVDPANPARIILGSEGGYLSQSLDRGATFPQGTYWGSTANPITRVATDIPWLAWTNETYMSNSNMVFDPSASNKLYFSEGIGVWTTSLGTTQPWNIGPTWNSQSLGIEQLVANEVISPPGGKPLVASWDRPVFYSNNPDVYPSVHGPNNQNAIVAGWSIDWASSNPSYIAGIFNFWGVDQSGYSTDGGQTWTQFASKPADVTSSSLARIGGSIAVSTPTNMVWIPSDNDQVYYTKNGGATWTAVDPPGTTATDSGWGYAYYLDRQIVAADRVTAGTFYAHNSNVGLFRSTDGGSTWTLQHSGEITPSSGYNAKLRSVPGKAGNLFFTGGQQSPNSLTVVPNEPFMRSTDGGATWTAIPNVLCVYDFGFGAPAVTGGYPSIYIVGYVNSTYGVWESDNAGANWKQVGLWPTNSLDAVKAVSGDMNQYGRVYVGFSGSGYAYGDIAVGLNITTNSPLASGDVGTAYSQTFAASGGTTPFTWTVSAGSLPAGLTMSAAGVLTGTPTTAGSSNFTIKVTDAASTTATKAFALTINPAPAITTASPLSSGVVGTSFSQAFTESGGAGPFTWSVSAGAIPAGLTLSAAGVLSGTPTTAGTSNFTIKVTDAASTTATKAFALKISPANQAPTITSAAAATPNPAVVGASVAFTVSASDPDGDTLTYTWAFGDGAAGTGAASSHSYTSPGAYSAVVTVSDPGGLKATSTISVTVKSGSGTGTVTGTATGTGTSTSTSTGTGASSGTDTGTGTGTGSGTGIGTTTETSTGTGVGGGGTPPTPMIVKKLQGTVSFKSSGHDSASILGVLPNLPSPIYPNGQKLTLNVGGATVTFVLNKRGQGKSGSSTFALTLKPNKKSKSNPTPGFAGGNIAFKAKLTRGSWAAIWGINSTSTGSNTGAMTITIALNGIVYADAMSLTFTSSSKTGARFVNAN